MAEPIQFRMSLAYVLLAWAIAMPDCAVAAPIQVDDESRYPFEELYSEPLQGFRGFPIELFAVDFRKGDDATINSDIFLEALEKSDDLRAKMADAGIDLEAATWEQIEQIVHELGLELTYHSVDDWISVPQSADEYLTRLDGEGHAVIEPHRYDPNFLVQVLTTEAFDDVSREHGWRGRPIGQMGEIRLDDEFAFDVFEAYGSLRLLSQMQPQLVSAQFRSINEVVSRYPRFANLAKHALGFISIGKPVMSTSDESELKVPDGLKSAFDFFVVLFAVTVRDDLDFVESITFSVSLPQNCSVFDLFPLRHGIEAEVTEEYSAPGVTLESGGAKIAFSSIFKQTLEYGRLKPTVVGYGLQEAEFGWAFRDEAAGLGSHRVAAIVGVPKKAGDVPYTTSIYVKGKDRFLAEGEIASSRPRTFTLLSN